MKHLWPPPSLRQWCADVDADPAQEWLLEGLLPADAAVLVSGKAKITYKTWFASDIVVALATGQKIAALKPAAPKVKSLVLALEGPRKPTRRRWDWLFNTIKQEIPDDSIYFAHRTPVVLTDPGWRQRLRDFVKANDIKLVVIDTLAKASTADENSVKEVGDVMRSIDSIRSAGVGTSVMFLHHLRKPAHERGGPVDIDDEIRGTSAISGFYDTHLALRESPGGHGLMLIARQKDEAERYFKVNWKLDAGLRQALLEMDEFNPDEPPTADLCWEALNKLDEGKVYTFGQLCAAWGYPAEVTDPIISSLLQASMLEKTSKGWRRVG